MTRLNWSREDEYESAAFVYDYDTDDVYISYSPWTRAAQHLPSVLSHELAHVTLHKRYPEIQDSVMHELIAASMAYLRTNDVDDYEQVLFDLRRDLMYEGVSSETWNHAKRVAMVVAKKIVNRR